MSGRDIGASVRQRLLNRARSEGRPFQELLQYFAMERFLYRLAGSRFADRFVLKGALLLMAWRAPVTRPTMDIDLAGKTSNDLEHIRSVVGDVAVGTAYGVDPEEAMCILTRIANEHPLVLKHPEQPIALFTGFGDSSLQFVLRFWCDTSNWIPTSSEIYTSINDAFRSASIEIPFPQRDLHIREIPQSLRRDDGREIVTES